MNNYRIHKGKYYPISDYKYDSVEGMIQNSLNESRERIMTLNDIRNSTRKRVSQGAITKAVDNLIADRYLVSIDLKLLREYWLKLPIIVRARISLADLSNRQIEKYFEFSMNGLNDISKLEILSDISNRRVIICSPAYVMQLNLSGAKDFTIWDYLVDVVEDIKNGKEV